MSAVSGSPPPASRRWYEHPNYPWLRLVVALLLGTLGGSGMYAVVVVLPNVQADFGTARMGASLPYTLTLLGFGAGSLVMGPIVDRFRVIASILVGAICLAVGFFTAAQADSILTFSLANFAIGLGCSATFAPLIADISLWFTRRRGLAVAMVSSGNYLSGTLWPPIVQYLVEIGDWRSAYMIAGTITVGAILAMSWVLRPVAPGLLAAAPVSAPTDRTAQTSPSVSARPLGFSPNFLHVLLCVAGFGCCMAMSMPQVHIVAMCSDLGYGTVRGAQMLSVMLAAGIVSRLAFGWISDHIGGVPTLLLGATLQAIALALFLPNQSLDALFVASALFGLFQGGIVPSYAMIVREHFPPAQVGTRIGVVITSTLMGMAVGGWVSGAFYDLTGSYEAAFFHSIAWNIVTIAIAVLLMTRTRSGRYRPAMA